VLGQEEVDRTDNFFALGGTLALGVEMISRAGAAGVLVSPQQLLAGPTIAELVEAASAAGPQRDVMTTRSGTAAVRRDGTGKIVVRVPVRRSPRT
jgi:hypothetical protein